MSVFITTDRRITLDTDFDISTATSLKILYETPGGKKGEWTATGTGTDSLYADLTPDEANIIGIWKVQAEALISGYVRKGNINSIRFKKPLDVV